MFRLRRRVYCDNNATTMVTASVRRRMNQVLKRCFGNPSSLYRAARDAAEALEDSRRAVASAVNVDPSEIIFTGSATEANNTILVSVAEHFYPEKKTIIASPIEHASVNGTLDYLQGRGFTIKYLPVDRMGQVDPDELERLLDDDTFLVCCMLANNETGVVLDVKRLAAAAHRRVALMMSDCVQALGKIPVDLRDLEVDYASFSAHKIHGPKGVGALYVRDGCPIAPYIHGGHQESGLRAGTEGVHNIAGFAAACSALPDNLIRMEHTAGLKRLFIEGLRAIKPDIVVNTPPDALPNTASVTFPGVNNAILMGMLDYYGIAVSAGSACNTGEDKPSHVLTALGLNADQARSTIRFSLSGETVRRDIRYLLAVLDDHFTGRTPPVSAVAPTQLDEGILLDERTFIVDVRHWYDRKLLKGLPNAVEFPLFTFRRHMGRIPRDRNILVVCQTGYDAPVVAYWLRSRGCRNVGFLMAGMFGWKLARPDLYQRLAGTNIRRIGDIP